MLGAVIRYIDGVSADIETQMRAKRPVVQGYIDAFKAKGR
jgi:hypothetical protein